MIELLQSDPLKRYDVKEFYHDEWIKQAIEKICYQEGQNQLSKFLYECYNQNKPEVKSGIFESEIVYNLDSNNNNFNSNNNNFTQQFYNQLKVFLQNTFLSTIQQKCQKFKDF